jgi:hypothetical protein
MKVIAMSPARRMLCAAALFLALFACGESAPRLAFDNAAYPDEVRVRVWLDSEGTSQTVKAQCTVTNCRTEQLGIPHGRHRIRLQVLLTDGQASAITDTTVER